ncbi:metallophosphoesterase family protein [Phaeobacter porticola]|uniref:Calcineurin-like phosphoesterase n=1 Tax=Phaeobacter porticola TaxID=1844006 RepID=A0A1L3IA43_9RHOB|nr:metallophosphoesterase family protein [Phaeobacter porticola]APG48966.1 Calcineurin-like phosphoesterase [Phaeobacter porticola]
MFKRLITRFWRKRQDFAAIDPGLRFYVIGDVHGCDDLLAQLLEQLDPGVPVVCLGDYVDRGEQSSAVLRRLMAQPEVTALMGNHESMLLDFLRDPSANAAAWLRSGGLQTLASFDVGGISERSSEMALKKAADTLADAMGGEMIEWLRNLPLSCQFGNVFVAHAGADPGAPVTTQSRQALLWGHREARLTPRSDGVWVVHGHWIVSEPIVEEGRIALDTGAFATGRLTAAELRPGSVQFIGMSR